MALQSTSILATLAGKSRRHGRDRSQHLLCPTCRVRTRLYALADGRRKCSACGKKFHPRKKSENARLRQYADLVLCFVMDMPARQASTFTGYRYRLVLDVYDRLRRLLAEQNLMPGKIRLLLSVEGCDRSIHDSEFCSRCRERFSCKGRKKGDAAIFGVKLLDGGRAFIDPLEDREAMLRFGMLPSETDPAMHDRYRGYAGFICKGTFHRFAGNPRERDGAEQLWAWLRERLRRHHGVWRKNTGLYLKELEWKYNHRQLPPERQALRLTELLPDDFLSVR